ncbi:hypothetical protein DM860_009828 [Cuscuta australis]|uniref:Uncharacterized protein n=1 Tax=Cuscuta australis TaxID=267555 RepID=A0A328DC85_9ASTE|nr:hypothetical protein DM860_009828 [Cuscuta australis]
MFKGRPFSTFSKEDVDAFSRRFRFALVVKTMPEEDSPIVPCWISIPNLPIHLHDPKALFTIASHLGKPLKVDNATLNFSRPSVARVCAWT